MIDIIFSEFQWHIFLVNLDPVVGSEQGKIRPVLVISNEDVNQILPVVNILPITSKKESRKRIYPNESLVFSGVGGLKKDSIILSYQIRTIDKSRLIKEVGIIDDEGIKESVINAMKFQLDLI